MKLKRSRIIVFIAFTLCLVGAFIIRYIFLQTLSLRLDEAQSLNQAVRNLSGPDNLFQFMAGDVHPPLYILTLHFWIRWFGDGVAQMRFVALILGTLTVPLMYFLGKEVYSRNEGVIAMLIAAVNPIWIWYSVEVKNYALLLFSTALSFLFFFKIVHKKYTPVNYVLYILAQALGMYSHYFFFFVILIQIFGAIVYKTKRIVVMNMIAFVFFIPWVYYFLKYHSTATQPIIGAVNLFNIILLMYELTIGYHSSFFYTIALALWPLIILLSFIYIKAFRHVTKDTMILIFGIFFPVIMSFLVSEFVISVFLTRYLIFVSIFIVMILAKMIMSSRYKFSRLISVLIFIPLLLCMSIVQMHDGGNIFNEDYRDAVYYVQGRSTRQDIVVVSAAFTIYPFEYYYKGVSPYVTLPAWNKKETINFNPTPEQMNALVQSSRKKYNDLFLVESYDQSLKNDTVKWFDTHLQRIDKKDFGYNVSVYEYKLNYNTPKK